MILGHFHSTESPRLRIAPSSVPQIFGRSSQLETSISGVVWDLFRRKLRQQKVNARVWHLDRHAGWQLAQAAGTLLGPSMPIMDKEPAAISDSISCVPKVCPNIKAPARNSCRKFKIIICSTSSGLKLKITFNNKETNYQSRWRDTWRNSSCFQPKAYRRDGVRAVCVAKLRGTVDALLIRWLNL